MMAIFTAAALLSGTVCPGMDKLSGKALAAYNVLSDEKAPLKDRMEAFYFFCTVNDSAAYYEIREKYKNILAGQNFNAWRLQHTALRPGGMLYYGNFKSAAQLFDIIRSHKKEQNAYDLNLWGVRAYAGFDSDKAAELAEEFAGTGKYTPAQRFILRTIAAALSRTPAEFEAWFAAESKTLDNKSKADALVWAGRYSLIAGKSDMTEKIGKVRDNLYKPVPRKQLNVAFTEERLAGVNDWRNMKNKPEMQKLNRQYGGNLDFLATDVATGNRGADAGVTGTAQKPAEFSIVCSKEGVHMLFRVYDEKAPEVEAKMLGGGSLEIYLAPGINQPYICLLPDLSSGAPYIFQTSYSNESYRRLKTGNPAYKQEIVYNKDSYELFISIPWDTYYNKLPDPGDVWEFEVLLWGRGQGGAWNGAKTIHGRSDWGRLVFRLTEEQRSVIQKRLIFLAMARYKMEKQTNARIHGCIDFWKDPVLGDPEFYKTEVLPLVTHLDSYLPLVKLDMSDADVKKVFLEAVPYWNAMRFKIDSLREKYMRKKLSE